MFSNDANTLTDNISTSVAMAYKQSAASASRHHTYMLCMGSILTPSLGELTHHWFHKTGHVSLSLAQAQLHSAKITASQSYIGTKKFCLSHSLYFISYFTAAAAAAAAAATINAEYKNK
jgi:hypothetical protein